MERKDDNMAFMLKYENIAWYEDGKVRILDRRVYPMRTEFVTCSTHEEIAQAIADMVTQSGGPYIAAAMGIALSAYECREMKESDQLVYMDKAAYTLTHARPTTVEEMVETVSQPLAAAKKAIMSGADAVQASFEIAVAELNNIYTEAEIMGNHLADKFPKNGTVMTQCFGETIVGMMLRACKKNGNDIKVICPETRPYFQGARLTASCIRDMGFDVSVITDNMPGYILKNKGVDVFTSAADVICMDGHIVNKVGTFQIALAAHYWDIPYYVTGRPNAAHELIESVKIEERDPDLVMNVFGNKVTMDGVNAFYPAFDITPPKLCSGVVTDKGIFSPYNLDKYYLS